MCQKTTLWVLLGLFGIVPSIVMPLDASPRVGQRFIVSDNYCKVPCEALYDRRGLTYYSPEAAYAGITPFVNKADPCEMVYVVDDTVRCIVYGGRDTKQPFSIAALQGLLERYTGATTWRRIPEVGFFERVENEFLPIDTSYYKFVNNDSTLSAYHGRAFYVHSRYRLTIMANAFLRLCSEKKKKSAEAMTLLDMYRLNDTVTLIKWAEKWHGESMAHASQNKHSDGHVQSATSIVKDFVTRITRPGGDSVFGSAPRQPFFVMATALSIRIATDTVRDDLENDYRNIGLDLTVNKFYPVGDIPGKKILYLDDMKRHELLAFIGNSELCTAYNGDFFLPSDEIEAEKRRSFLSKVIEVHQTGQIKFCAIASWQCCTEPAAISITFDPSGTRANFVCTSSSGGCCVAYCKDSGTWRLSKKLGEWVY